MKKLTASLGPEMSKFIKESFPVTKKRSALWFFCEELKKDLSSATTRLANCYSGGGSGGGGGVESPADTHQRLSTATDQQGANGSFSRAAALATPKMSRNKVLQLWRNMDPESKRWYFKMAELDEVRYREQKSIWVTEVMSLLKEHGSIERAVELAPSREQLQGQFEHAVDDLHKSYEQMIETESTKMIYKDAIRRAHEPSLGADELIQAVPRQQRGVLTRPRRPPSAFVLYLSDNMDRYVAMRRELRLKTTCTKLAASEWADLEPASKLVYEERYDKLKLEYDNAMREYKAEFLDSADCYLQTASREKRAFRKSLRKRLRDSSILPGGIRNSFNFFVMDNRDARLKDLLEVWRTLAPDAKEKYLKLNEEDKIRYQREIEAYNEMRKTFSEIGQGRRRSKSESEIK